MKQKIVAGVVNIMILEMSKKTQASLQDFYVTIFDRLGYDVDIEFLNDENSQGEPLIADQIACDVFITDLSLGSEKSYDGLSVCKRIKQNNPDVLVIANSRTNVTFAEAASHIPSFDCFVYKPKMLDESYRSYICSEISIKFRKNVFLVSENITLDKSKILKKKNGAIKLESMLRRITFTSHDVSKDDAVSKVELSIVEGGYSGSEVFRMSSYTESGLKCINAVLKISVKEDYYKEKENYLKYVKWYLPYTWRPELIGYAETKEIGALCYSFIYNDEVSFKSLTEYIKEKDLNKLNIVIEKIFSPRFSRWYHNNNFAEVGNITKYYYDRWFAQRKTSEAEFCDVVRSAGEVLVNSVVIDGYEYPKPGGFLLGESRGVYTSCIRHGDLNTNNLLISEHDDISVIDFQEIGRGHVFEDFVVFEMCIRLYFNVGSSLAQLIANEYEISKKTMGQIEADDNGNIDRESLILKLRKYAVETAPDENVSNYFYALSLFCFRLLRVTDFSKWQKEQIIGCLLANMRVVKYLEAQPTREK